jgi:hypothetical protein
VVDRILEAAEDLAARPFRDTDHEQIVRASLKIGSIGRASEQPSTAA